MQHRLGLIVDHGNTFIKTQTISTAAHSELKMRFIDEVYKRSHNYDFYSF